MSPARSAAVNITWFVAPHGVNPAHSVVFVEFTRLRFVALNTCGLVVPSVPVNDAATGVSWYTSPSTPSAAYSFPLNGARAVMLEPTG